MKSKNKAGFGTSGRSMIEMLGVLAIIGILSAGGIAGYSAAMENHKVNKTVATIIETAAYADFMLGKRANDNKVATFGLAELCSLKIVPDEICKTVAGTMAKGFFKEKVLIKFAVDGKGVRGNYTVNLPDEALTLARPETYFRWVSYSAFPASACAKILSASVWNNVNKMAAVKDCGENGIWELPLAPADAYTKCDAEIRKGVEFAIIIWTDIGI